MKTYLSIFVNADGARPSRIMDALQGMGFEPTTGAHDFVCKWSDEARPVSEILEFGDRIHAALEGTGCMFAMETV